MNNLFPGLVGWVGGEGGGVGHREGLFTSPNVSFAFYEKVRSKYLKQRRIIRCYCPPKF